MIAAMTIRSAVFIHQGPVVGRFRCIIPQLSEIIPTHPATFKPKRESGERKQSDTTQRHVISGQNHVLPSIQPLSLE